MTHRITSFAVYGTRPKRQRGMVTIVVMLFLIATVVFALSQMLDVSSGNVIDGQRQGDSSAAFFIAESGLEKAHASVNAALGGTFTNANCSGVASNYNLGRGSVSVTAVSTPPTCSSNCEKCSLTSTGQVGFSTHTLTQDLVLTETNGVFCNGANGCSNNPVTWQLRLKNTALVAGIGVFNLTYIRQGNNQPTCAAGSNCRLQLDLSSPSNGANSVGLMGNSVLVPAGATYPIYQTMTKSQNNLAEVGAFFLGTTAPQLTGPTANAGAASYWDHKNSHAQSVKTVGSGETTGGTNDGTATSGGTCDAPGADFQTCTSWCYGGDTLVFSYAGSVTLLTDQLSSVTFGTNAGTGQNVAMSRVAKYPNPGIPGAPSNVDAEIWYARNPNFTGASPLAVNASSYKGRGSGAVGARWTSNGSDTTKINGTTLTVGNSFAGYPSQIISVGDAVSNTGGSGSPTCTANCGTITAQLTSTEVGGALGGRGTYSVSASQTVNAANGRQWTISSNVLHVTACTVCNLAAGDALPQGLITGRTISAQAALSNSYGLTEATGGQGRYTISGAATYVASGTNLYAGTPGTTLYLPSSSSQPLAPNPAATPPVPQTLITVKSGTGVLAPGTKVTAVNALTYSFTVSAAPTTPLDGASLCAGTCALFVPGTNTTFALGGITANFNEWAGGFTCLKGVDQDPNFVTSTSPLSRRWTEVIH
jgi:Tfp pilus assembly protein PilX